MAAPAQADVAVTVAHSSQWRREIKIQPYRDGARNRGEAVPREFKLYRFLKFHDEIAAIVPTVICGPKVDD